jgi:two-component system sensor histidine kinase VicK
MATLLGGLVVVALYGWEIFSGDAYGAKGSFLISQNVAIAAAVAVVFSLIFTVWAPKKFILPTAIAAFLLQASLVAYLIITTGSTASPFIALWILVSVFAGIFGAWGIVPLFIAVNGYMVMQYLNPGITRDTIVMFVLIGDLPLLASYLIWHHAAPKSDDDKAYRDLASELSQVANKSEVVINAIADGVIAVNSQGIIQLINPAAQQIIGWGKQDALALDYKSVLQLIDQTGAELTPATDPVAQTLATNKQTSTDSLNIITNSQ